jgi:diketogulonate reductase-like aldo/keto reductase
MNRLDFLRCAAAALAGGLAGARALPGQPSPRPRMLTRPIPRTGEPIPVVGLGTWQTFDPPRLTDAVRAELTATLRALVDGGGRVVDSSPMYGQSERVVGELAARAGVADRLFVATKVWTSGDQAGVRQMRESMARLRVARVDLMQVHNLVDWRTHLRTLQRWREEGVVRYVGVTHYQPSAFDELERIVARERVDCVQLPYSATMRAAERRLLPAAADAGVAVLVNRPFEEGGVLRRVLSTPLPEPVRAWAESWPQALLKFILANPAVTCVIPGTRNPRHMADNARAGVGRLPDEAERAALLRALA